MALIEFKDLPDTTTPINAENLNFNFNELVNECLTATISGGATLSAGSNVPFDTIYSKTEKCNFCKLENNKIVFNENCQVLASASIPAYSPNGMIWSRLLKNNSIIGTYIEKYDADSYATLTFSPKLINVKAGDTLSISIVSIANNGSISIGTNLDHIDAVFITVQKI